MDINSDEWTRFIKTAGEALGVDLETAHLAALQQHALLLLKWNRKFNLTTITGPEDMALKHYADSLAILRWMPRTGTVLDMGTGGGFPGIPLKIVRPSLSMNLIDSSQKKVRYLDDVIRTMELVDIGAYHVRVQDVIRASCFSVPVDVAVSRAFTNLSDIIRLSMPLVKPGGLVIAMKGPAVSEELARIENTTLPCGTAGKIPFSELDVKTRFYNLPVSNDKRSVVIIKRPLSPNPTVSD